MEFTNGSVSIDKDPSDLDRLILDVVDAFESAGIRYAIVSGYVAVLFGRSRATEDIDVITDRFDDQRAETLANSLREKGYWGATMPLDEMHVTLADDLPIRIAEDGHRVPNVEVKFANDEYDRISLGNTLTISMNGEELEIGALEFQIAYKLTMGAQKDFEDALYLYEVAGDNLNRTELEGYVQKLDVGSEYERLRNA